MTNEVESNASRLGSSQGAFPQIHRASQRNSGHLTIRSFYAFTRIAIAAFGGIGLLTCAAALKAGELDWNDSAPLTLPSVGTHGLRVISPNVLELILVNTKQPDPGRVAEWDFVGDNFQPKLPAPSAFNVLVNGTPVSVTKVGFKRRVLYAPLRQRDLRIGNYLYLEIATNIADGQTVEVHNPAGDLWSGQVQFAAEADPLRFTPAIHVNQVGYMPGLSKKAMVGYYLGSLGELKFGVQSGFRLIDEVTGQVVHQGTLVKRTDVGYTYSPTPYQEVYEADFSAFQIPGEYRLMVPGLGVSYPFLIDEGTASAFARTYALGLYHQRCGMKNELPFSRFTHDECHTAPADVPTMQFYKSQQLLAESSSDNRVARQTAPQLREFDSSLYPFVNRGKVDVSGGHHDAGDYSKYTINSAGLIHHLVFAVDAFGGVADLDNMGLPESGDGKSDLLQEAKWEADFLAKMQDADGGFYFLVYPRERRYEDDVLPEFGDSQVVWPKTTAVTAAAVAALAEAGSSPTFRRQFPSEAAHYLTKAKQGWDFLERAIATHGKDGSFQAITHYGREFIHDDELAWAAAAMFAATGESKYHEKLKEWFNPGTVATRRWEWWRLFEGYGCAVRTYAFAARTGRLSPQQLDSTFFSKCEAEIQAAAQDRSRFARESAYGTSFPDASKRNRDAGWYFSMERAFDLAVAYQADPRSEYLEALLSNMNYEGGCNPVNVSYLTGLGSRRQREIVHHVAQNDQRVLPPTGLPIGNVQGGFAFLYHYKQELGALSFPADGATEAPYPFYDRWGDSFNVNTEFVVVDQARGLAATAFLMGRSGIRSQPWRSADSLILGVPSTVLAEQPLTATLDAPGIDLTGARIVWEARDQQPHIGESFTFAPINPGEQWVEVEAQLPDGRRLSAARKFVATTALTVPPNQYQSTPVEPSGDMIALFHLDGDTSDATGRAGSLQLQGRANLNSSNLGWMSNRDGGAVQFSDLGDKAILSFPSQALAVTSGTAGICLEAMVYVNSFKAYNRGNVKLLSLHDTWNAYLELSEDAYSGPQVRGGTAWSVANQTLAGVFGAKRWHHVSIMIDRTQYTLKIDGTVVATAPTPELSNWGRSSMAVLEFGNFDGWVDEVVVRKLTTNGGANTAAPVVVVTDPQNGATYAPSKEILLTASAYSSQGTVSRVEFYSGNLRIGNSTTAPYQFVWANAPIGKHSITARVFDSSGRSGVSAPVGISVSSGTVIVSTPVIIPNGGIFAHPVPVAISTPTSGARIRFTVDGKDPDADSPIYDAPFTVSATATVKAKAFMDGGESATASATVVIDATSAPTGKAAFVGIDTSTQGNWKGVYGAEAFEVIGSGSKLPGAIVNVQPLSKQDYTWTRSTTDTRALENVAGSGRIASCWYAGNTFTVDLVFQDNRGHRLTLYAVDWDRQNRKQMIEILDANSGTALDTQTLAAFQDGRYLTWNVEGAVRIRVTNVAGPNAVLMGLFLDPGAATDSEQSGAFISARRLNTGEFTAEVNGPIGNRFRVEASTDLVEWTTISTNVIAEQPARILDADARKFPMRFYRIVLGP